MGQERERGRSAKSWINNTKDLTGLSFNQLIRTADDREVCKPVCQDPPFCCPTALKLWHINSFLRNILVKAEITVKDIKRYLLRICDVLLQSNLTGKQLTVLFHCCFIPIIIISVLSGFCFNLLASISI